MAVVFMDGFDHYSGTTGTDITGIMTSGTYAGAVAIKTGTGRNGMCCAFQYANNPYFRYVLPEDVTTISLAFALYNGSIPTGTRKLLDLRSSSNGNLVSVYVTATGAFEVINDSDTTQTYTSQTGFTGGAWHHVELVVVMGGDGVSTIKLALDEETILSTTTATLPTTAVSMFSIGQASTPPASEFSFMIDDLIVRTGDTTLYGDQSVGTLLPVSDVNSTWTVEPVRKFGTYAYNGEAGAGFYMSDRAVLELGSGDYTIEGWFKFTALPSSSSKSTLFAHGSTSSSGTFSYQLYLGGSAVDGGNLVFAVSTDGTSDTVTELVSCPFPFVLGLWYHIAVARSSGVTNLFVNGQKLSADVADTNTYYDSSASVDIGYDRYASTHFYGLIDEVRFTVGYCRYTDNFTVPTAKFGRSSAVDAYFSYVELLVGFDSGSIVDDSQNGITFSGNTTASTYITSADTSDDNAYASLAGLSCIDYGTVVAPLTQAHGYIVFESNPAEGATVTVGSTTYTFTATVSAANSVLIGSTAAASASNLVLAINASGTAGTTYGSGTTANADVGATDFNGACVYLTALSAGTAGNSVALAASSSTVSLSGSTLTGGQAIPGAQSVKLDTLDYNTTEVYAFMSVLRVGKSDSGTCKVQPSFTTRTGLAGSGTEFSLASSQETNTEVWETAPDGSTLSPATLRGMTMTIDRTE